MKLFAYEGVSAFIVIRAETVEAAVALFLERYPRHLDDMARSNAAERVTTYPATKEELATHFIEVTADGPAEIVLDLLGYDGGF